MRIQMTVEEALTKADYLEEGRSESELNIAVMVLAKELRKGKKKWANHAEFAKKGLVRLYLEARCDLPFSFDEPLPITEVVRKVAEESNFYDLVKSGKCEFAEDVHAILVDIGEKPGEYDTVVYETPEEINNVLYKNQPMTPLLIENKE